MMRAGVSCFAIAILTLAASGCVSPPPDPSAAVIDASFEFKGVKALPEAELRRTVRPDLDRYLALRGRAILDDAAFRLARRYRLEGYARVKVSVDNPGERVVFTIEEGPRVTLGRIHFEGNRAFSERELRRARPAGLLGNPVTFSEFVVARIRDQVLLGYGERGYVEAVIGEPRIHFEGDQAHVLFRVDEGPAYRLTSIQGLPEVEVIRTRFLPRIGFPYTPDLLAQIEGELVDRFHDGGHPWGRAKVRAELDRAAATATILVELTPGPHVVVGALKLSGQKQVRESFLRERAAIEQGEPYRSSRLKEAEKRLLSTGLFRSVRALPSGVQEGEREIPIELDVEEREPGEFSVRGGYGTLEGPRVGADFSYHNLLGGGELFRLGGTASRFGWRAEAETAAPYFLGSEFRPGLTSYYETRVYPSYEIVSPGGALSVTRPLWEGVHATLGWRLAQIRTVEVDPSVPPGDLLDFSYTAPFASLIIDFRDSALLPTRGVFLSLQGEWSAEEFGSDIEFVNLNGKVTGLLPLLGDLVAVASLQGGRIAPVGDTRDIPISLRYFAGGTNSVRGFKYASVGPEVDGEPTGGEAYLAIQAELRFPIWDALHGAVFWDEGGVWFKSRDFDLSEFRYAVGSGLRYYTPAGAIVVDVAWNRRRREDEDALEVHLSIGFPF